MARYNFNRADSIQDRVNAYLNQSANRAFNDRTAAINRTLESRYSNWTYNPRGTSLDRRTIQPSRVNRRRPTRRYKNVVKPTNTDGEEYTIKAGDTLSGILKAKGINADWRAVAKANGIADGNRIIAGQKIKLPSVKNNSSNSSASAKPEAAKPALSAAEANRTGVQRNDTTRVGQNTQSKVANNSTTRPNPQQQRVDSTYIQRPDTTSVQRNDTTAVRNSSGSEATTAAPSARASAPKPSATRGRTTRIKINKNDVLAERSTLKDLFFRPPVSAERVKGETKSDNTGKSWLDYAIPTNMASPGNASTYGTFGQYTQKTNTTPRQGLEQLEYSVDPILMGLGIGAVKKLYKSIRFLNKYGSEGVKMIDRAQRIARGQRARQEEKIGVRLYNNRYGSRPKTSSPITQTTESASNAASNSTNSIRNRISNIWGNVKQRVRNLFPESGAENVRVSEEVGQRTVRDTRPFSRRVADWRERLRTDKKAGYDVAPKPRTTPRSKGDHYGEVRRQFGKDRAVGSTRDGRTFEIERGEASRAWKPKNAIDRINRNAAARSSAPKPAPKPAAKPATKAEPMVEAKPEPKPAPKPAPKSETKAAPKKPSTGGRKSSSERRAERAARGSRKRK